MSAKPRRPASYGLPAHYFWPVDKHGEGPEFDLSRVRRIECWCHDPDCDEWLNQEGMPDALAILEQHQEATRRFRRVSWLVGAVYAVGAVVLTLYGLSSSNWLPLFVLAGSSLIGWGVGLTVGELLWNRRQRGTT